MMVPTRSAVEAIGSSVWGSATMASVAKLRAPWACAGIAAGPASVAIASKQAPSRRRLEDAGWPLGRPGVCMWNSFVGL
jgi:hypothetical protein